MPSAECRVLSILQAREKKGQTGLAVIRIEGKMLHPHLGPKTRPARARDRVARSRGGRLMSANACSQRRHFESRSGENVVGPFAWCSGLPRRR
jgi:hypothetical protein